MENKTGVALVGGGGFGQFCLEAFAEMPEVRIVAVVDSDLNRAKSLARKYKDAAYADLEPGLAKSGVGCVQLCTPPYLHAAQGIAALEARKHVFCETPLALTIVDGELMIQTASENGVRLTVNYVMRYNPFWTAASEL